MRFADSFSEGVVNALSTLGTSTNTVPPEQILHLQITYLGDTMAIATGPNPVSDLLDMTVLVTLSRMAVENYIRPLRGDAATRSLLNICKQSETEIWQLTGTLMNEQQQSELRAAIKDWYEQHSGDNRIFYMRAVGIASELQKSSKSASSGSGNVFGLLGLDPLARCARRFPTAASTRDAQPARREACRAGFDRARARGVDLAV